MLISSLYTFKVSAAESLETSGSTELLSDALELEYADLGKGAEDAYLVVQCIENADTADGVFLIKLTDCAATGGTYYQCLGKQVPIAEMVTGAIVYKAKLPESLKKFNKLSITGVGTTSGKVVKLKAAIVTG